MLPAGLKNAQNGLSRKLEENDHEKFNAIEKEMHKLYQSLSRVTASNYILEQLHSLMSKAESIKSIHPINHDDIEQLFREFSEFIGAQQKFFMTRSESNAKADYDHSLEVASNELAVFDFSVAFYQQFAADEKKLDAIDEAINADIQYTYSFEGIRKTNTRRTHTHDQCFA